MNMVLIPVHLTGFRAQRSRLHAEHRAPGVSGQGREGVAREGEWSTRARTSSHSQQDAFPPRRDVRALQTPAAAFSGQRHQIFYQENSTYTQCKSVRSAFLKLDNSYNHSTLIRNYYLKCHGLKRIINLKS